MNRRAIVPPVFFSLLCLCLGTSCIAQPSKSALRSAQPIQQAEDPFASTASVILGKTTQVIQTEHFEPDPSLVSGPRTKFLQKLVRASLELKKNPGNRDAASGSPWKVECRNPQGSADAEKLPNRRCKWFNTGSAPISVQLEFKLQHSNDNFFQVFWMCLPEEKKGLLSRPGCLSFRKVEPIEETWIRLVVISGENRSVKASPALLLSQQEHMNKLLNAPPFTSESWLELPVLLGAVEDLMEPDAKQEPETLRALLSSLGMGAVHKDAGTDWTGHPQDPASVATNAEVRSQNAKAFLEGLLSMFPSEPLRTKERELLTRTAELLLEARPWILSRGFYEYYPGWKESPAFQQAAEKLKSDLQNGLKSPSLSRHQAASAVVKSLKRLSEWLEEPGRLDLFADALRLFQRNAGNLKPIPNMQRSRSFSGKRSGSGYAEVFPTLAESLEQAGEKATWLDSGCGTGLALNEYDDAYGKQRNQKLVCVDLPEENRLKENLDSSGNLRHLQANIEEPGVFAANGIQNVDVITDLFGAFSYTRSVGAVLQNQLDALKVGGKLFIRGAFTQVLITDLERESHSRLVSLNHFLEQVEGVTVQSQFLPMVLGTELVRKPYLREYIKALNNPGEDQDLGFTLVLTKTTEKVRVPKVRLNYFRSYAPPFRYLSIVK